MNFKLINVLIISFSLIFLVFIIYISGVIIRNYPSNIDIPVDCVIKKRECIDRGFKNNCNIIIRNLCNFNETNNLTVTKVIDGDTFQLYNGEIIRLICVDTPEEGKKGFEDSKLFLESLIMNREVRLEPDINDKDIYGRSLRYVYVSMNGNEVFVNKEMVKYGLAEVFRYGNNTRRCGEISISLEF